MAARILSSSLWPAQGSRWDVTASTERLQPLEPGSRAKSLGRAWGTAVTAPGRDGDGHVGQKAGGLHGTLGRKGPLKSPDFSSGQGINPQAGQRNGCLASRPPA